MAKLITDRRVRDLIRLYEHGEVTLTALVADALASGNLGAAGYRRGQLASVQKILAELTQTAVPMATEAVAQSYMLGSLTVDKTIGTSGAMSGVHQEAVAVLADNLSGKLNEAAATVGRRVDDVFRKEGLRAVANALVEGSARRDATGALVRGLARQGVTAFTDVAGRNWGLSSYASMHVRTVTREAVSHGTANRLLENGYDLVTVSSHDTQDDVCQQYDGETFSLSGSSSEFDQLDEYPPFHPNCEHVLTPAEVDLGSAVDAIESATSFAELDAAVTVG